MKSAKNKSHSSPRSETDTKTDTKAVTDKTTSAGGPGKNAPRPRRRAGGKRLGPNETAAVAEPSHKSNYAPVFLDMDAMRNVARVFLSDLAESLREDDQKSGESTGKTSDVDFGAAVTRKQTHRTAKSTKDIEHFMRRLLLPHES